MDGKDGKDGEKGSKGERGYQGERGFPGNNWDKRPTNCRLRIFFYVHITTVVFCVIDYIIKFQFIIRWFA